MIDNLIDDVIQSTTEQHEHDEQQKRTLSPNRAKKLQEVGLLPSFLQLNRNVRNNTKCGEQKNGLSTYNIKI